MQRSLLASDGAAIVYLDKETRTKGGLEQGVFLQDIEDETLTHFTQSTTANLLKITFSKAGDDITEISPEISGIQHSLKLRARHASTGFARG
jgi:hypothetical protein